MGRIKLPDDNQHLVSLFKRWRHSSALSNILFAVLAFLVGLRLGGFLWPWASCPSISCYVPPPCECSGTSALQVTNERRWDLSSDPPCTFRAPETHQHPLSEVSGVADAEESPSVNAPCNLADVLGVMQHEYFELWMGTWPTAIDWTAAVMGTFVSASLTSIARLGQTSSRGLVSTNGPPSSPKIIETDYDINTYFSHTIAYYFGQDAFAIRLQAYDDMLWVVLGWLEATKFNDARSVAMPAITTDSDATQTTNAWHGQQFSPVFAHRARIFYDLAKKGYDYSLCGGGMLWNPSSLPYKNAITNELYITASIEMYLYFKGDNNSSPFNGYRDGYGRWNGEWSPPGSVSGGAFDAGHLQAAVEGYKWLKNSNMTNDQGLFADGFHIKDYGINGSIGTGQCDELNRMVYTYNQGVILSGLRGLWEGTGDRAYLDDGHRLVRAVIGATGWDLQRTPHLPPQRDERLFWHGLGRAGILEDLCDADGDCNQDAQAFKGIFFHHLTLFCEPLPTSAKKPGKTFAADRETAFLHSTSCKEYADWVIRNAQAALNTRNEHGKFGMWWSPGLPEYGGPPDLNERLNDRGRGRTVETQGGGLSVVRAMNEFSILKWL